MKKAIKEAKNTRLSLSPSRILGSWLIDSAALPVNIAQVGWSQLNRVPIGCRAVSTYPSSIFVRLPFWPSGCIHSCMSTSVLTVRLSPPLLTRLDRKAAAMGRTRAEHVRQVLEADLSAEQPKSKRFACLPLKGRYALGLGSDNAAVRRALRRSHEKNR